METMRDALFNQLFIRARQDPGLMVLTTDFTAPAFDRWRAELPDQFLNTGIAEQNAVLTASGLALGGMKVFVVGIAPFITMRCLEQIRLYPADLGLDVSIVGVGAGFSYHEAGATHHAVEDLGLMALMPNIRVYSPSGNVQLQALAERIVAEGGPHYLRLDRRSLPELYAPDQKFGHSLADLSPGRDVKFLATGAMTHEALKLAAILQQEGLSAGLIDVFGLPPDPGELAEAVRGTGLVVTLEEHLLGGGLGAAAAAALDPLPQPPARLSFGLDLRQGLCHRHGPRPTLWARQGLDLSSIPRIIKEYLRNG